MSTANAGTLNNNNNNDVSTANAATINNNNNDVSTANAGTVINNNNNNNVVSISNNNDDDITVNKNNKNNKSKYSYTEDKPTENSGKAVPKNHHSTDHTTKDFCEVAVRMGLFNCGQTNCSKRHDFDQQKLREGLCFKELRRKKSCNKGNTCKYSHQIPSSLRNDPGFLQSVVEEFKKQKSERTTMSSAVLAEKPTCTTEYYGGHNACKSRKCDLDHNLNHDRIYRGPCFYEFYKEKSCPYGTKCNFTHKFPTQILHDPSTIQTVASQITKSRNKDKVTSILGSTCVKEAENYTASVNRQPSLNRYNNYHEISAQPEDDRDLFTSVYPVKSSVRNLGENLSLSDRFESARDLSATLYPVKRLVINQSKSHNMSREHQSQQEDQPFLPSGQEWTYRRRKVYHSRPAN